MKNERKSVNKGTILAESILDRNYGEIVRFQEIERIINERRGTQKYYQAIQKAKKILEENGKIIQHISGGDYQVIYPGDYATAYTREIRLANKRVKHGGSILAHAPVNDMTVGEKQIYDRVSDFHATMQARMSGSTVEVKKLANPHPFSLDTK